MRLATPRKRSPSCTVARISPSPNRPITTTRKLTPPSRSLKPKVSGTTPVTLSMPTVDSSNPAASEVRVLSGAPLPIPMKAAKARK